MADWGDGVSAIAAPWVQLSVSAGNGWPHNALRHHWLMPISWHFRDCKALLVTSLTHLSGAITSVQTFTFTFTYLSQKWSLQFRILNSLNVNLRTQVKHLIVRIYLSKLNTKLYVTYYSYRSISNSG